MTGQLPKDPKFQMMEKGEDWRGGDAAITRKSL